MITELGPGEQTIVEVGIQNASSLAAGTQESGTVTATVQGGNTASLNFSLTAGVPAYSATDASTDPTSSA